MGVMYKITNRVWGISDLPVPVFFGLQAFLVLKWLVYYIGMILLVFTYPFLYIYGVGFLIKTKQKPNWFYFALYTALFGWYIYCIVKYWILGYTPKPLGYQYH